MEQVAAGVHVVRAQQGFYGLEVGTKMTVLQLDGGLLVHSPIAVDPATLSELGTVRWIVAPNLFHHLYVPRWTSESVETWCCPGLPDKRKDIAFTGVLDTVGEPFGEEVLVYPLRCFSLTRELVLLHRPSRTLLVTDLFFNLPATTPALTKAVLWAVGGYPGCRVTLFERLGMRRDLAREDIGYLLGLDFDRVIMAHGDVVETGGREVLRQTFAWLGLDVTG